MTPLPPVADALKVTQGWQIGNNLKAESILHFAYTGSSPDSSACVALAADINAAAATEFKGLMVETNAVGLTTVLDINSDSGAAGTGGEVTPGTLDVEPYPASTAIVINHAIARRYRGGKPRTYAPFGSSNNLLTAGTFNTTFTGDVTTAWASFITSCLAASSGGCDISTYISVSYFADKVLRETPHVDTITSSLARQAVGTQRRRNKNA